MARLKSSKANGLNSRSVEVFDRPISSVSRGNSSGPNVTLYFRADDPDDDKARDYSLNLDEGELIKVVKTLTGDISNTLLSNLYDDRSHDRFMEPVLNQMGIFLATYRVIAHEGYAAFQTHFHVRAVDDRHAAFQFGKLKPGSYDADSMERLPE